MFTNNKPTEGSIDTPPQFPPPSVLGKNNALPSSGSGVYGSPLFVRISSKNPPAKPAMFRRPVIDVLQAERVLRQRWRLDGKRLRLRSRFAWHRRLGHRPFF